MRKTTLATAVTAALAALPAPAALAAPKRADDHGTKVTLNGRVLKVAFTGRTHPNIRSFIQGKPVVLGCVDDDMRVLASKGVDWRASQTVAKVRLERAMPADVFACFVASPSQVDGDALTGARVLGFFGGQPPVG